MAVDDGHDVNLRSPKQSQTERIGGSINPDDHHTNKRAIVTEMSAPVEQDQDVEALGADGEEIKAAPIVEDYPP